MTPSLAIFNQLYIISENIMDTYDYLPNADAKYPFCFIEKPSNQRIENNELLGEVNLRIHWFGKRSDLLAIDHAVANMHDSTLRINSEFNYSMVCTNWTDSPLPNPIDEPKVIHHIAELTIRYTRKER